MLYLIDSALVSSLLISISVVSQVYRTDTLTAPPRGNKVFIYVPQQASSIVDPVESQEPPKWLHSCDYSEARLSNSRYTKSRLRRQTDFAITSEIVISGPVIRLERSTNASRKLEDNRQTNADYKANILFKVPKYGAKKTTFSSSKKSRKLRKNNNYYRPHQSEFVTTPIPAASLMRPPLEVTLDHRKDTANDPSQGLIYEGHDETINALLSQLTLDTLKLAWTANSAINQVKEAEQVSHRLHHALAYELDELAEPARQGIEPKRKWLPQFEKLVHRGFEQNRNLTGFAGNLTDYFQYFGVAFEQISFERIKFDTKHQNSFSDLDLSAAKLICSLEQLKPQLEAIESDKIHLIQMVANKNVSLTGNQSLARYLNSTIVRRVVKLEANGGIWLNSPKPSQAILVDRQVMPVDERLLRTSEERLERDCSILADFNKSVQLYQTFLVALLEA